jgi:hypothetical protein
MTAVGPFLDFRDFSPPAGELDVVADLEVSHLAIGLSGQSRPALSRKDRTRRS